MVAVKGLAWAEFIPPCISLTHNDDLPPPPRSINEKRVGPDLADSSTRTADNGEGSGREK